MKLFLNIKFINLLFIIISVSFFLWWNICLFDKQENTTIQIRFKTIKVTPQILYKEKRELSKLFKVKIQYFELRNTYNFKISNKIKNSKIFVAFFINNVRLIDNF